MREFLKGLELDQETIDTIMAEYGKMVTKDKEELQTLKSQISELKENSKNATDLQKKYDELEASIKEQEAKKKAEEEDKILTNNITAVFGDKKFVNDYTKNSIVSEIKNALSDKNNVGKSAKDLFEEITKDKEGIFVNPNKPQDMAGANPKVFGDINAEAFNKMGYRERVQLKAENPDLFAKLNDSQKEE